MSKFVDRLLKVNTSLILKDIMNCFMSSCGVVLIITFFSDVQCTKSDIKTAVTCVFLFFIMMLIVADFMSGNSRWIYRKRSIDGDSFGKAELVTEGGEIADYNKRISAVHEAGHAVMAYLQKISTYKVYMSYTNPHVATVYELATAENVKKQILIEYAGAVAEELMLGEFTYGCMCGAKSDFSSATELIKAYIVMTNKDVSKSLIDAELDTEIVAYSKIFYQEVGGILNQNKNMLEVLSEELLKTDCMSKEDVEKVLDNLKNKEQ